MLASHRRLRSPSRIQDIFQTGESFFSPYFKIVRVLSPEQEHTRLAVVAGKKGIKRAVDRNRVKRRLRSAIQETVPAISHVSDIIVIGNARVLDTSYEDLVRHLNAVFKKL